MALHPSELRAIPLFHRISDQHLTELMASFTHGEHAVGDVLFEAGSTPQHFLLLSRGEVSLYEGNEVRFRLKPVSLIGELGALTGVRRNTTARVSAPSEIWTIATADLMAFFEKRGEIAVPFYHNLLGVVAGKVRRDELRIAEMRANLIHTQKEMKRINQTLLEAEETPLSALLFETMEALIEHNKRGHYTVEPWETLRTAVRHEDKSEAPVLELSDERLAIAPFPGATSGTRWSGVLILGEAEIPVSGIIERSDSTSVVITLDLLIEEYGAQLADHLTRLQMLDFVV